MYLQCHIESRELLFEFNGDNFFFALNSNV